MVGVRHGISSKGDTQRRFEVVTGAARRRRRTTEEKMAIVAESFSTPLSISDLARRHGFHRNQLSLWRRQFREGKLCVGNPGGGFVPVVTAVTESVSAVTAPAPSAEFEGTPARIEVVVGAMTVRVPSEVSEAALRRVLGVIRGFE
jgi:transposase